MKDPPRTRVCLLSPLGRSAVAVLAVAGPRSTVMVDSQFRPMLPRQQSIRNPTIRYRLLGEQGVGRIFFGRWGGSQGEEVVVCRRHAQYVEVHCHGGRQAAYRILGSLVAGGCQAIPWQEWTRQQADDLLQAEARMELAYAQTQRSAAILLEQCQGSLHREIEVLKGEITACRDNLTGHVSTPARKIETLLEHAETGMHLTCPWRVLLAGRPNVGKSSLINALLGYKRAIVFEQPGTTRDILSATTAMEGWPVQLSDTAGMHETSDRLELLGIQLAREQSAQTDLLVWVLDATLLGKIALEGSQEEMLRLAQRELAGVKWNLPAQLSVLYVLNKIDLVGLKTDWRVTALRSEERGARGESRGRREAEVPGVLPTCATSGAGVDCLVTAIAACLVPCPPSPGAAVPWNDRQQRLLQLAAEHLQHAQFEQALVALDELLAVQA